MTTTWLAAQHKIVHSMDFDGIIKIPTLLDLAAMKTYALQRKIGNQRKEKRLAQKE